ncbi:hypothetical protein THTE_2766 [Thermogutta terrifontis]|uniref:Uncharacterized protein n=1 Tax=Thermogutta terrifontis TaxID=1331910 RepID=A0A286RHD7_9BACT|nr:hypothetical protein THTE_2766 [Thermogutta terrifontis]
MLVFWAILLTTATPPVPDPSALVLKICNMPKTRWIVAQLFDRQSVGAIYEGSVGGFGQGTS